MAAAVDALEQLIRVLEHLCDPTQPGYQEAQAQLEAWQRQNASQLACGLARVWTVRTLDPSTRQLAAVIVKNLLAKGLALDDASLAELRGHARARARYIARGSLFERAR